MEEAGWVPVAVDPLVPAARLGALMVERRTAQGLALADLAERSNGMFTVSYLENAERGRLRLDDRIVEHLVGLYQLHAGPVVPERSELVLDIDRQELQVGDHSVGFESLDKSDVLDRYVSLVYLLRSQEFGTDLTLRDQDLDVLSHTLGHSPESLRSDIRQLIEAPESVLKAKAVSRTRVVLGAGLIVGFVALGALALVGGRDVPQATQVLGTQQTLLSSSFASEMGAQAEALIEYDFRSDLRDWEFIYADENPSFRGVTLSESKTITVHVRSDSTVAGVAEVLMHEVGHALDLERMNDEQRAQWIELRGIPATWWPGNGLSDFAVGAGDFAEAVAALTTGSPSSSVYGDFTEEQLAFVAEVVGTS